MATPDIKKPNAFPGACARFNISVASGVEPSEHTSIMVATMMVIAKPVKVGPNNSDYRGEQYAKQ